MIDDIQQPVANLPVPVHPLARPLTADEAIDVLRELMHASESEPTRLGAAKTVLERIAPKQDEETRRREKDERNAAIAEAKGLLADLTAAKLAGLRQPAAVDQAGTPEPDNAADNGA